jgi:hypothetical protein
MRRGPDYDPQISKRLGLTLSAISLTLGVSGEVGCPATPGVLQ